MKIAEILKNLTEAQRRLPSNVPPMPNIQKLIGGLTSKPDSELDRLFQAQQERDQEEQRENDPGVYVMFEKDQNNRHWIYWGDYVEITLPEAKQVNQAMRFNPHAEKLSKELGSILNSIAEQRTWLTVEIPGKYKLADSVSFNRVYRYLTRLAASNEHITSVDVNSSLGTTSKKPATSAAVVPHSAKVSIDQARAYRINVFKNVLELPSMLRNAIAAGNDRDQVLADIDELAAENFNSDEEFISAVKDYLNSL